MADESQIDLRKGARKRKFPEQNEEIRKQLYNTNQGYYRKDGRRVNPKVFKPITKCCVRRCHSKLKESEQSQAFLKFYELGSYELRSSFLNSCVSEVEPARRTKKDEQSRRGYTKIYTLSNERVCKTLFCNLLQISSKRIETSLKKTRDDQPKTITSPIVQAMSPPTGPELKIEQEDSYCIPEEDEVEYLVEEDSYTNEEEEEEIIESPDQKPKGFDESFVCSCPNGCTDKLPVKTRRQLYQMFWNIGTNLDRNTFVNCCVSENKRPSTGSGEPFARKFFLKGVEICEPTFTKTLMITSAQIDLSLQANEDSEEEVDPKEKIADHIRQTFKVEPLLDFMCCVFNDENPDCPVSESDYKETFFEKFTLQLTEKETNLHVL